MKYLNIEVGQQGAKAAPMMNCAVKNSRLLSSTQPVSDKAMETGEQGHSDTLVVKSGARLELGELPAGEMIHRGTLSLGKGRNSIGTPAQKAGSSRNQKESSIMAKQLSAELFEYVDALEARFGKLDVSDKYRSWGNSPGRLKFPCRLGYVHVVNSLAIAKVVARRREDPIIIDDPSLFTEMYSNSKSRRRAPMAFKLEDLSLLENRAMTFLYHEGRLCNLCIAKMEVNGVSAYEIGNTPMDIKNGLIVATCLERDAELNKYNPDRRDARGNRRLKCQ